MLNPIARLRALYRDPEQIVLRAEMEWFGHWAFNRFGVVAVVLLGLFAFNWIVGFGLLAGWAFLMNKRISRYFQKEKIEDHLVTPLAPRVMFPALIVGPSLAMGVALTVQLVYQYTLAVRNQLRGGALADSAGMSMLALGLLVFAIVFVFVWLAAFSMSAVAARSMLKKQGIAQALFSGGVMLVVYVLIAAFASAGLTKAVSLTLGLAGMSIDRALLGFLTSIIGFTLTSVIAWKIYRKELAKLSGDWLSDRLRQIAGLA